MKKKMTIALVCGSVVGLFFIIPCLSSKSLSVSGPIVENFALPDENGRLIELYQQRVVKAVALVSFGLGCPIVKKMAPELNRISEKYHEQIRFFYIDGKRNLKMLWMAYQDAAAS